MKLRKISRLIPHCSAMSLLVLGLITLNPICSGNALLSIDGSSNDAYAAENINTGSSISLTIDGWTSSDGSNSNVSDSVTTTELSTAYISHNVSVSVSNAASYSLQLTAASGKTSNLVHENGTTSITGANGTVGKSLSDNTWGYSWGATTDNVANMTYYTLPAYGTTGTSISTGRLESASPNGSASFTKKLTFAAKFGKDAPDGSYGTEAVLALVVSPTEQTVGLGFAGYTTMQEITKAKCNSSDISIGTEGRLKDARDGKIYWVAKLKDGLCWMTQNLDYDGGAVAGYSGSDVATLVSGTNFASNTQSQKLYYDPEEYVYTLGSGTSYCSSNTSTGFSGCTNNGWSPVSSDLITNATLSQDDNAIISMHYHAGNYYNWMAATNGTGGSVTSIGAEASGSICPTGWSLPLSRSTATNSFGGLLSGLNNSTNITVAPYYFVYGGFVDNSSLNNAGSDGNYWSATVFNSSVAYFLYFNSSSVDSSGNYSRYYGLPVRCVAR